MIMAQTRVKLGVKRTVAPGVRQFDLHSRVMKIAQDKLAALGDEMLSAVKSRFDVHRPSAASSPGSYPRKISTRLKRSIVKKRFIAQRDSRGGYQGFQLTTDGPYAHRLNYLTTGFTNHGRGLKLLAIPISTEARIASSKGIGPRERFGSSLRVAYLDTYRKSRKRTGKRKICVLVERSAAGRSGYRDRAKTESGFPRFNRGGAKIHYVLHPGPVRTRPRRGLMDAISGTVDLVARHLGAGWEL